MPDPNLFTLPRPEPKFHGETYVPEWDEKRLKTLLGRVYALMSDEEWRTLGEIKESLGGGSEASISARLRQLRNDMGYTVGRRRRGEPSKGLFEYRVIVKQAGGVA